MFLFWNLATIELWIKTDKEVYHLWIEIISDNQN